MMNWKNMELKKIDVFETSAKTGANIAEIFDKLVDNIIINRTEEELIREFGVNSKPRGLTITSKDAKPAAKKNVVNKNKKIKNKALIIFE